MMTRITDMHGDLQAEGSWWLFKSQLAGGGGILWRPHFRPHNLLNSVDLSRSYSNKWKHGLFKTHWTCTCVSVGLWLSIR